MFRLKLLIILLALGLLSLFYVQNRELLSLKVLCADVNTSCLYQTPPLPTAAWILLFAGAGMVTSLFLQALNSLTKGTRSRTMGNYYTSPSETSYTNPNRSSFEREFYDRPQQNRSSEVFSDGDRSQTSSNTQDNAASKSSRNFVEQVFDRVQARTTDSTIDRNAERQYDWDDKQDDDWNLEEPPKPTNSNRENIERSLREEELKSDSDTYETKQQPKNVERSGSVYSYKFREAGESKQQQQQQDNKVDRVYDANYRLINPPYSPPSQPTQPTKEQPKASNKDDEDWI
jgi:hypothetical protein